LNEEETTTKTFNETIQIDDQDSDSNSSPPPEELETEQQEEEEERTFCGTSRRRRENGINTKLITVVIAIAVVLLSVGGVVVIVVRFSLGSCYHVSGPEYIRVLSMTTLKYDTASKSETAIFAGGCFWSIQLSFDRIPAVLQTSVGYTGGTKENPTYAEVSTDTTGHVESVQIEFDPRIASYEDLVKVFFERHDPTTLNQQGNDRGSEYRSAIFYFSDEQRITAIKLKQETQQKLEKQVVTEVSPASRFWDAETYHQKYLKKHGYSDVKGDTSQVPCYA